MPTPTQLAHGLAGNLTHADWPALRSVEVLRVTGHYPDVGAPVQVVWRSKRPLSAAALVQSPHGRFFLKRHHQSVRSAETLAEEHRFITHLRGHGVPIPAVLTNADGQTATTLGTWVYELHACASGIDLYRDSMSWQPITQVAHAHTAGRMLAALHRAAVDYHAPQRTTHILVARSELLRALDPIATLCTQLQFRPGLADYLRARDWQHELAPALTHADRSVQSRLAAQPALWTHGDWHASNLCWSDTGDTASISAVLDFGLSAANFALFDLATAIERNAIAWLALDAHAARLPIARALIAGYREVRALDATAVNLLAALLPRVHVDFALAEIEYYHGITHSDANADVAYNTFLLGHAAWFHTHQGCALLDAIRQSA